MFSCDYLELLYPMCYNACENDNEWRKAISVSYDKLWKMLIAKKMNRTDLKDAAGISFHVLAKMGKNKFISMESLQKICQTLSCNIGDIMDFIDQTP